MTDVHSSSPEDSEHNERMRQLQAEMRDKMRAASEKRGLVLVHTGNGKGKTTAAFGMVARTLGHGRAVAVIQFIKTGGDPVEKLLRGPRLHWHRVGDGFTWDTQDRAADIARCRDGWSLALRYFQDPDIDLVVLDEMNIVLSYDYLPLEEVLAGLRGRREGQHVVVTGRGAPQAMIDFADLVTEMREIKHPFHAGVKAQAGLEF